MSTWRWRAAKANRPGSGSARSRSPELRLKRCTTGESRQQAAFASGRVNDAVTAQSSLERWLPTTQELRQSRINLLASLRDASERNIRIDPRSATDPTIRGWLELGPIAAAAARSPNASIADVDAWRSRYPNHPASDIVRSELLSQQYSQQQQPTIVSGGGSAHRIAAADFRTQRCHRDHGSRRLHDSVLPDTGSPADTDQRI